MTPQAPFFVLAPVRPDAVDDLLALLEAMNLEPGRANPHDPLVPFADFERLHFARFCIVRDETVGDVAVYGMTPAVYPPYLAFVGDVDGSEDAFLRELVERATPGLVKIFSHCENFDATTSLFDWMKSHAAPSSAWYANWKGRTMLQIREEAALRGATQQYLDENAGTVALATPLELHAMLRRYVSGEIAAARLTMTPDPPTRFGWWISNAVAAVLPILIAIILAPVLAVLAVVLLVLVRIRETSDPVICPQVDPSHRATIAVTEDRDVTNAFCAVGSVKPGMVRRIASVAGFFMLNYASRHVFTRGRLGRVRTIHFARWVWLDNKRRLAFMSNYDGSLESYMDDFINKAGFGLNFVFSNGIGYPKTRWLVADGCKDEQKFKNLLYRHQCSTQVWYNGHSGLTTVDLQRNAEIRAGLEAPALTAAQAREWAALL